MASSTAHPHDDMHDGEEARQHLDSIAEAGLTVSQNSDTRGDGDQNDDSIPDNTSERELLAQYNVFTRLFPPPVLSAFPVRPKGALSKTSLASQPLANLVLSDSQSNMNEIAGTTFSASNTRASSSSSQTQGIAPDEDGLKKTWLRVVEKKMKVSALRSSLFKARQETKRARAERDAADNTLMSLLRPLRLAVPSAPVTEPDATKPVTVALDTSLAFQRLPQILDRLQETRNRCQAAEVSLEDLEDELDDAQEELDQMERLFINTLRPGPPQYWAETEKENICMPETLLGLQEEPVENYHPLYMRFMSTFGSHGIAEEHYQDNLYRKADIEDELYRHGLRQKYQQSYTAPSEQLDASDLEFMSNFEEEEKKSLDLIARLKKEANDLRDLCFKEGLVPRYAEITEIYTYYPQGFSVHADPASEMDQSYDENAAAYTTTTRFWLLLSNPYHLLEDEPVTAATALHNVNAALAQNPNNLEQRALLQLAWKEDSIENHLLQDAREGDKGNFINRWLLHKLRISPHEVELMYSSFTKETRLHIHDAYLWQQHVLYHWPRDDAARAPPAQYKGAMSKVQASSQGSISDSIPDLPGSQPVGPSDEAASSANADSGSPMETGSQPDADADDEAATDNIEADPPDALRKQDNSQPDADVIAPEEVDVAEPDSEEPTRPEELHSLESEVQAPEEPKIQMSEGPHVTASNETNQTESPSGLPLGGELEVKIPTPEKEDPVQSNEPGVMTDQVLVLDEEERTPSEQPQSHEPQEVLNPLSEAPTGASQDPKELGSVFLTSPEAQNCEPEAEPSPLP